MRRNAYEVFVLAFGLGTLALAGYLSVDTLARVTRPGEHVNVIESAAPVAIVAVTLFMLIDMVIRWRRRVVRERRWDDSAS